jgi:serine/threonine-protein kinase PRP4
MSRFDRHDSRDEYRRERSRSRDRDNRRRSRSRDKDDYRRERRRSRSKSHDTRNVRPNRDSHNNVSNHNGRTNNDTSDRKRELETELDNQNHKKISTELNQTLNEYDEKALKAIENLITTTDDEDNGDLLFDNEEKEAERLAEERRRRRLEIMRKHHEDRKEDATVNTQQMLLSSQSTNENLTQDSKTSFTAVTSEGIANLAIDDDKIESNRIFGSNIRTLQTSVEDEAAMLLAEQLALEQEAKQTRGLAFDMFSSSPTEAEVENVNNGRNVMRQALLEGEDPHLQSNWDDGEGYYKVRIGEILADRYQTLGEIGKGVFSTVLKCLDLQSVTEDNKEGTFVAIKLIRNNDTMRKAAEKEKSILLEIAKNDPENKRHCVRIISAMEYRSHVALVFEHHQMNLHEALKKFGKDVGINISAVRIYARQLFIALRHLADLKVVHADIKLHNILCSGDLKQVKICDFGSAFREDDPDNNPTPYLVSRFYRAPEIILGLPYDRAIDVWSVAVCLYELFTGHVMFPGRTNNEMLKLMMAVKGRMSNKQIKSHFRAYDMLQLEPHFHTDMRYKQLELDPVTKKVIVKYVDIINPTKDLLAAMRSSKAGGDDPRLVANLTDLLDKCISLDPAKRIQVNDALKHPFFTQK